jgi:very-short-patch-repair endonuclease
VLEVTLLQSWPSPDVATQDDRTMTSILCSLGHIATTQELLRNGVTQWQLHRGVARALVTRPRRGVYACDHVDRDIRGAAELGGAITCVTVLRREGVWAGHDRRLHVQLHPAARSPKHGAHDRARLHWEAALFPARSRFEMTVAESLRLAVRCLDSENAIAALESAGHEGVLPQDEIVRILQTAPRRLQRAAQELEFRSGSGNETIVRLRLQGLGFRVESQGHVPGLGHQDLVIEDCVGLEVDGRQWHGEDRFAIDRDRDIHSEGLGRRALRLRTSHIFDTWPQTLSAIERAVSDATALRQLREGRPIDNV